MKRLWFYVAVISLPIASVAVLAAIVWAYKREIKFPDLSAQIIASFFGAFFAYLFLRAADILDKRAEIESKNLAALGKLAMITNESFIRISHNRFELRRLVEWADKCIKEKGVLGIFRLHAQTIPFSTDALRDLSNTEFVNQMFRVWTKIDSINEDLRKLSSAIDEQRRDLLDQKLPMGDFLISLGFARDHARTLIVALENAENECATTMASARVLAEQRSWLLKLKSSTFVRTISTEQKVAIDAETRRVRQELVESREQSRRNIEQLFGGSNA